VSVVLCHPATATATAIAIATRERDETRRDETAFAYCLLNLRRRSLLDSFRLHLHRPQHGGSASREYLEHLHLSHLSAPAAEKRRVWASSIDRHRKSSSSRPDSVGRAWQHLVFFSFLFRLGRPPASPLAVQVTGSRFQLSGCRFQVAGCTFASLMLSVWSFRYTPPRLRSSAVVSHQGQ
jgi:hypothetical protein